MADKFLPDFPHLPANLPEDWEWDQIISPNGSDAGKPAQYGYNYLMQMVNRGHQAANMLRNAAESFSSFSENFTMDFAALNDDLAHRYTKPEVDDLLSTKVNQETITWHDLPTTGGATSHPINRAQYCKLYGVVHLRGRVIMSPSQALVFANLPVGFRPPPTEFSYFSPSNGAPATNIVFSIISSGDVYVRHPASGTTYNFVTGDSWDISCSFAAP